MYCLQKLNCNKVESILIITINYIRVVRAILLVVMYTVALGAVLSVFLHN